MTADIDRNRRETERKVRASSLSPSAHRTASFSGALIAYNTVKLEIKMTAASRGWTCIDEQQQQRRRRRQVYIKEKKKKKKETRPTAPVRLSLSLSLSPRSRLMRCKRFNAELSTTMGATCDEAGARARDSLSLSLRERNLRAREGERERQRRSSHWILAVSGKGKRNAMMKSERKSGEEMYIFFYIYTSLP